eukprot:COSAG03_NODE_11798_length_575_cov_1.447479_1_plen_65_part_10
MKAEEYEEISRESSPLQSSPRGGDIYSQTARGSKEASRLAPALVQQPSLASRAQRLAARREEEKQ